jgi:manganese/zinc/iron transport system ATP- binding protein
MMPDLTQTEATAAVQPEVVDGNGPAALDVADLTVSYQHKPVLRRVNVEVKVGELIAVVGPNGAGKSTFLKAVLGLVPLDAGQIRVLGQPIERSRRRVAYVPQTDGADWDFPVSVREVVLMGRYGRLGLLGRPSRRDGELVEGALRTVGMAEYAERHIRQLSGGQQQRVFLARALAQEAEVLLLDEPFAGVDARTEEAIFELMGRFSRAGKTLVVVNHNLQVADRFGRILLLNQVVVAYGRPGEVMTVDNLRRAYGGRISFLEEAERQLEEGRIHDE